MAGSKTKLSPCHRRNVNTEIDIFTNHPSSTQQQICWSNLNWLLNARAAPPVLPGVSQGPFSRSLSPAEATSKFMIASVITHQLSRLINPRFGGVETQPVFRIRTRLPGVSSWRVLRRETCVFPTFFFTTNFISHNRCYDSAQACHALVCRFVLFPRNGAGENFSYFWRFWECFPRGCNISRKPFFLGESLEELQN